MSNNPDLIDNSYVVYDGVNKDGGQYRIDCNPSDPDDHRFCLYVDGKEYCDFATQELAEEMIEYLVDRNTGKDDEY